MEPEKPLFQDESLHDHPFSSKDRANQEITLILISDLHNATDKLEKLKNWYATKNEARINYVVALGDFDNLDNDNPNNFNQLPSILESNISHQLLYLEFFTLPILYIPGNHDSPTLYTNKSSLTQHSTNIHGGVIKLAQGLQIVGFGGSVPAYVQGKKHWAGWPFKSEQDLGQEFERICQDHLSSDTQTILATHVGPWSSATTKDTSDSFPNTVDSGSLVLDNVVMDEDNNILVHIHGHTHEGVGRSNIRKRQVINPGSLMQGDFALMKLSKDRWTKRWAVRSTEFICLNAM